jgi:hypothetical protein
MCNMFSWCVSFVLLIACGFPRSGVEAHRACIFVAGPALVAIFVAECQQARAAAAAIPARRSGRRRAPPLSDNAPRGALDSNCITIVSPSVPCCQLVLPCLACFSRFPSSMGTALPLMGTACLKPLPLFPILGLPRALYHCVCAVKQTVNTKGKADVINVAASYLSPDCQGSGRLSGPVISCDRRQAADAACWQPPRCAAIDLFGMKQPAH